MAMKENRLRYLLNHDLPSVATRIWSTNPFFTEAVGASGNFDYVEFLAEYSPVTQLEMENLCRAAELHDMASIIKVDFQNRGYVAQKAIGSGFQGVLFTDHQTPEQVRETIRLVKSETPEAGGRFGYPNKRFIGFQPRIAQMDHARRVDEIVLLFMIEKAVAVDNIEEICSIPGVDMIQFGPSDYCMSRGWNVKDHREETRAAERHCIEVALAHGVQPRCEIHSAEAAKYYMDLGVRHFCLGDQLVQFQAYLNGEGKLMREAADALR